MEKYTIDIDKVLDEFEETEALKVHSDKKPDDNVIEQCLDTNSSTTLGTESTVNSWIGNAFDVNKSQVDNCNKISVFDSISDTNLSLQKENLKLDEHLNSSSCCTLGSESNVIGTNKAASSFNTAEMNCNDDANPKRLSYDIFYKTLESDSDFNDRNIKDSKSLNCQSDSFSQEYGLGDYSPDEILCVSVEENKTEIISNESHVESAEILSADNSVHSNYFLCNESDAKPEILNHSEVYPSLMKEILLDKEKTEIKYEFDFSENSKRPCHPNTLNLTDIYRPDQPSLIDHEQGNAMMDEHPGQVSRDYSCLQSQSSVQSQPKHDVLEDVSGLVYRNVERRSSDSRSLDDCLNQIVKGNDLDVHNVREMEDVQLGGENVFGVCGVDIHRNALDLENGFSVQDDDSGVSSTEDISGNSPPEMMNNEAANNVVIETCDIKDNFSNLEPRTNKVVCNSDTSSHNEDFETPVSSSSFPQSETELNENDLVLCDEKETLLSTAVTNITTSTVNDYVRSKFDHSNSDVSGHIFSAKMGTSVNEESNNSTTDSTVISSSITSKKINQNTELKCNFESENSDTSNISKNIIQQSDTSNLETINLEVENSSYSLSGNEANYSQCVDEVLLEQNSVDSETMECTEDSNLILDTNDDCISPRLQRPTTLNLPSLLTATPETSDAALPQCDGINEQLVAIDVSSEASMVEPNVEEIIPFARQQPQIGIVKPYWIPDAEALNCMHCGMKFTVLKRRHHCRGCGKVLCSRCCNQKAYLAYLNKEDRICQPCSDILASILQNDQIPIPFDSQSSSSCGSSPNFSPSPQMPASNYGDKNIWRPHPNNPDDYCSTIPPLQQIQSSGSRPPPTVMVPIGVLKRGNKPRREPKQVIFSDGIRPGGDLTDLTEPVESVPVYRRIGETTGALSPSMALQPKGRQKRVIVSDGEGPLPPVVLQIGSENDDKADWNHIFQKIQDDAQKAVNFALMKNMHLFVKLTKLDCCFGNECWCFTSHGLCTVGQDEVMVIMEKIPGEKTIPRDIFKLFSQVYDSASKGSTFDDLGHIIFPEQILGSSDHRGFLFVRPTFQCLSKLTVPNTPYLVAILIHKWEVPWAKVFPLRLMLRMGAECRYYPCSLVSVRYRKPVYFEIGQTIMSVLADLRNFQFTIPVIPGLVVHMEEKKTCVNIPRNRYEKVVKVFNSNNVEHVLALGSNFSTEADSHLVCMQKEEGDYQTQAINIENTTRKVTGASFIVFSGALKSTSGLSAKFSIVEDGLLIQIPQETMVALHMALRDMRDLSIECGQINAEPEEIVILQWTRDDKKFNIGVRSSIDNKSFEGVPNLRIHTSTDYAGENYLIRWTEVFFLDVDDNASSIQNELVDPCRLAETVAQSCCMALTPYLDQLAEAELMKLGLRVTLDSQSDRVEYDIGARGKALPAMYMNALDSGLIPVILRLSSSTHSEKLSFELIFHILIK